jgi:hypothetical protein
MCDYTKIRDAYWSLNTAKRKCKSEICCSVTQPPGENVVIKLITSIYDGVTFTYVVVEMLISCPRNWVLAVLYHFLQHLPNLSFPGRWIYWRVKLTTRLTPRAEVKPWSWILYTLCSSAYAQERLYTYVLINFAHIPHDRTCLWLIMSWPEARRCSCLCLLT